jgi:PEP-CTERM motif
MMLLKTLLAAAVVAVASGAQAQVSGSLLASGSGSYLALSSAGLSGGSVATLSGGMTLLNDMPFADIPAGTVFGSFLAAGVMAGPVATLTFAGTGVDYVSFLWGSPDTYNLLSVTTNAGTQTFTTTTLGFGVSNGDQSFSQYVQFAAQAGSKITSISYTNTPNRDAFEAANFSVTPSSVSPVPEPQTYALLGAGVIAVLFLARRRRAN